MLPDQMSLVLPEPKIKKDGSKALAFEIKVNNDSVSQFLNTIQSLVAETVATKLSELLPKMTEQPKDPTTPVLHKPSAVGGVELPASEILKAKDLRMALLLGKLPEKSGLLVDAKVVSSLLNLSVSTLYRLMSLKAVPEPVKIGETLTRWRLAELLEWIDAGCPNPSRWTYPGETKNIGKGKR